VITLKEKITAAFAALSVRGLNANQRSYHNPTPLRRLPARSGTLYCMSKLSHFDEAGEARMVDVSGKSATRREAEASVFVAVSPEALAALPNNPKGNPLEVARIAGIQAAKRTAELIPMCHPLPLTHIDVATEIVKDGIKIRATASTTAGTGVEMEALTAASIAALTIYDMCKALDKGIVIREIRLETKTGGKSGDYKRPNP
jgi:cyclic pyranopterin phosphate synthase